MLTKLKAVAADIDMTLTAKGGDLPEITKEALTVLHENGILIGLATGRELNERLYRQFEDWGLPFPVDFLIGMNGGMIWDRFHEDTWTMDLMSCETMKEILTYMKPLIDEYLISVNVEGGGNISAMNIHGELFEAMMRHGWDFEDHTGDIDGFCAKPCYKILFRMEPETEQLVRDRFLPAFGDRFQMISTYPGTVEVIEKNITKGSGLIRFAEKNNISVSEIMAFGDNENDNPLLEAAGWGVCLADGNSHTKEIADDLTEFGCEEGGAGIYLVEHYLRPNGLWNK